MCGIAGLFHFCDQKIENKKIFRIIKSIKSRGPDDDGFWISDDKQKLLVNTRLAIQDISKNGKQPMAVVKIDI